jgi:hypothetical protein
MYRCVSVVHFVYVSPIFPLEFETVLTKGHLLLFIVLPVLSLQIDYFSQVQCNMPSQPLSIVTMLLSQEHVSYHFQILNHRPLLEELIHVYPQITCWLR